MEIIKALSGILIWILVIFLVFNHFKNKDTYDFSTNLCLNDSEVNKCAFSCLSYSDKRKYTSVDKEKGLVFYEIVESAELGNAYTPAFEKLKTVYPKMQKGTQQSLSDCRIIDKKNWICPTEGDVLVMVNGIHRAFSRNIASSLPCGEYEQPFQVRSTIFPRSVFKGLTSLTKEY